MNHRRVALAIACLISLSMAGRAGALSLSLVTTTPQVSLGSLVVVDVIISGLAPGAAPSLGSFDLDVSADSALGFQDAAFSLLLGDPDLGQAITAAGAIGTTVDLFELSLLLPAELDALQPDTFTLATITFSADEVGLINLSFTQDSVGDAFGQLLPVDESVGLAIEVPEPGLFPLLLLGSTALRRSLFRRSRRPL
jgi:hypothetical protein